MKSVISLAALAWLACACNPVAAQAVAVSDGEPAYYELQKVVILSRHGVRAPTQSAETLESWSPKEWPKWGVERGYLTPRGYDLIKQTWQLNAKSAPFVHANCPAPNTVQVIADSDERTVETAKALIEGLYPGCGISPKVEKGKHSALFSPVRAKVCKIKDPESLARKLTDKAAGASETYRQEIELLNKVADGNFFGELVGTASKHKVGLKGGPYNGASFAELLSLEWGQWPGQLPGWDSVSYEKLKEAMKLRVGVFSLLNRDMEVARYKGSELAKRIIDTLSSDSSPRFTYIVGHDTNLANMGAMFDLDWQLPDRQPNENVPGGYLKFEKWLAGDKSIIRISYSALSPEQMHKGKIDLPPVEYQILKQPLDFNTWAHRYKSRIYEKCTVK